MSRAADIDRASRRLIVAERRYFRAARIAFAESRALRWAIACEPGRSAVRKATAAALGAQNAALGEFHRLKAIRAKVADAWSGGAANA